MKWKSEDMEKILGMEEYVDTLVYPISVSPMKWDTQWIAEQFWLEKVCFQLEQSLTGRVFLFQPLCVAREGEFILSTMPFIQQSLNAMSSRFPYCVVVTNSEELSSHLQGEGIPCFLLNSVPDEEIRSKRFLEKTLIESNRLMKKVIGIWQG